MSLANILDVCLEDIQSGAATIEDCLARYPEHAPELEPLLEMAVFLERAAPPKPAPAFKAALRRQLMDAPIPESNAAPAPAVSAGVPGDRRPLAPPVPAWAGLTGLRAAWGRLSQAMWGGQGWLTGWAPRLVTGAALLFFLTVWLSTTTFAAGSLPGEPLYSVKRAGEQVRLVLALNPFDRAQLHARLAVQRLQEAEALAARGQTAQANALVQEAQREQAQAVALGLQITIVEPTATPAPPTSDLPASGGLSAYPSPSATAPRPTVTLAPSATLTRIAPIGVPTHSIQEGPASVATATSVPPSPVPPATNTPTAVLPLPTRTAVIVVAAASYPSPTSPPLAYPVPPSPTAAPPTDTPVSRPPQPTARPLASATKTPGSVISNPGASATPTPPPSATPTPQPRPQRTPVPIPSRTPLPATATSVPVSPAPPSPAPPSPGPTGTSGPAASPTPAPPIAPSATPATADAATDTPAPPPAPTQGATPQPTKTP